MARSSFIAVVGHLPDLMRDEGASVVLRALGAQVRTIDFWDEPHQLFQSDGDVARAVLVEALDRPDLGTAALRSLRRESRLAEVGAILAVTTAQVARLDPSAGFDDFVLSPYVPPELYARIRLLEWKRSEFATEERVKMGRLVLDRAAHEATLDGQAVGLTAKEFALLSYLCEKRGKLVSRNELLNKVWGAGYEGGARTVDIHVRRLRAKFGLALPLATLRGAGYKLSLPDGSGDEPESERNPDAYRSPDEAPSRGVARSNHELRRA